MGQSNILEYLLLGLVVVLVAALVVQHVLFAAALERRDAREREERAMYLQRIQDPAQAVMDHSVTVNEPVSFYPSGEDDEVNELLTGMERIAR